MIEKFKTWVQSVKKVLQMLPVRRFPGYYGYMATSIVSRRRLANQTARVDDAFPVGHLCFLRDGRSDPLWPPGVAIDNDRTLNSGPVKSREITQPDAPLTFIVPVQDAA